MDDIIEKLNTCEITDKITCDIETLSTELKAQKAHVVRFLLKHFKNEIDFKKYEKKNILTIKSNGGHNKTIYKLTDRTFELIKQSYNLKNRYVTKIENLNIVNVIMTLENSTIGFICSTFKNIIKCERQFKVGRYKVDLYMPNINTVIECDENGHNDYNFSKEKLREIYIIKKLKCTLIRYNPNSKDFDLSNIMNQILIIYDSIKK